jgi:catechol 2,3-dioxygenase-like lactoylglutathione lyase family enzyme
MHGVSPPSRWKKVHAEMWGNSDVRSTGQEATSIYRSDSNKRCLGALSEGAIMSASCITRGIDHVGMTVPNLDEASCFFEDALGAVPLYDNITKGQVPYQGPEAERKLDLAPGTSLVSMRMMKLGKGPDLELFEMRGSGQNKPARPSDFGLQHLAVYVDDINEAAMRFQKAGGELITPPNEMLGLEKGPGNAWLYARTPWGSIVELITSPSPKEYEKQTPLRRWTPERC